MNRISSDIKVLLKSMGRLALLASLLMAVLFSVAVKASEAASTSQLFVCEETDSGQYRFTLEDRAEGEIIARVTLVDRNGAEQMPAVELQWVRIDRGYHFRGAGMDILGITNAAVLYDGQRSVTCQLQGDVHKNGDAHKNNVPNAVVKQRKIAVPRVDWVKTLLNVPAVSLGGKLRSGPGTTFKTLGIINKSTEVILLEDTGVWMNGYEWFRLQGEGITGYQWGGLLCSKGLELDGVYQRCEP